MANAEADPVPTTTLRSTLSRTMTTTDHLLWADTSVDHHHVQLSADIAITAASQHGCRITHTEHPASSNVNPYHDHPSPNVHTPTSFTIVLAPPRTHQIYTTDHAVLALGSTKPSESAPPYDATILRGRPPQMLSTTPDTTAVSKKHPRLHETDRADAPANAHGQPHTPHLTPTVGPQP